MSISVSSAAAVAPSDSSPTPLVAQRAQQMKLGDFISAEHAMGGRVIYNFDKGSIYVQNAVIQRYEMDNEDDPSQRATIDAAVVKAAVDNDLGAFTGEDWGLGHAYVHFEKGDIWLDAQSGAMQSVDKDPAE